MGTDQKTGEGRGGQFRVGVTEGEKRQEVWDGRSWGTKGCLILLREEEAGVSFQR